MPPTRYNDATRAAAEKERRRRVKEREAVEGFCDDPVRRLLDPAFTDKFWYYENSRIGEQIPGNLHSKQSEALANKAAHRWLFWGNQTGKTSLGAIEMALYALGRHPQQPDTAFVGWASALSWDLWERVLLPELLTWIPKSRIVDAPEPFTKSTKRDIVVRADNGSLSRITGKSAEQGAAMYQSARVHFVWLDEEHPESIWDEMQPRLLRFGGRTLATMTPLLGMTWVYGRVYEPVKLGQISRDRHWYSHAGIADNPAITPEALAELRAELKNNPSQLAAREHGLFTKPIGAVYDFTLEKDGIDLEGEALVEFVRTAQCYGGIDLGLNRFAFAWGGVGPDGTLVLIDEVFSQREDADARAKAIDEQLKLYHVKDILIYADCADPTELQELNDALARMESKYYVLSVEMKNKRKTHGIARMESLITRKALKMRRTMGRGKTWYCGKNSNSSGRPVLGSRWLWEITNWQYPKTPDGKVQKDEPDDATADGADMMDGTRYLVMQWLGPVPEFVKPRNKTLAELMAQDIEDMSRTPVETDHYGTVLRQ